MADPKFGYVLVETQDASLSALTSKLIVPAGTALVAEDNAVELSLSSETAAGQDTFASSSTKLVTLSHVLPDTNYTVVATPNVNETIWTSDKTTSSFTLHSSNSSSTAVVDWALTRRTTSPSPLDHLLTQDGDDLLTQDGTVLLVN